HRDRLVEQAARVVAQIEDVALHLVGVALAELADRLLELVADLGVELADADVADVVALLAPAHRAHLDGLARERELERLARALAPDLGAALRAPRAAHLPPRWLQRGALDRVAVELGDHVVRLDAGARGGRVVDRRDALDQAVLHGDLHAEPAELAVGL